jgi:hypothetical protein
VADRAIAAAATRSIDSSGTGPDGFAYRDFEGHWQSLLEVWV